MALIQTRIENYLDSEQFEFGAPDKYDRFEIYHQKINCPRVSGPHLKIH